MNGAVSPGRGFRPQGCVSGREEDCEASAWIRLVGAAGSPAGAVPGGLGALRALICARAPGGACA